MGLLSGKRLAALAAALMALAAAAAARVVLSGDLAAAWPPLPEARTVPGPSHGEHVALARDAERRGDIAAALAHYRAASVLMPGLVDRRSPEFLGKGFEENLKRWAAGLRSGRIPAGPGALADASYLFRVMFGGCG